MIRTANTLRKFSSWIQPFDNSYGPPGRSANSGITATVFGAYGFVGRYFLYELGNAAIDNLLFQNRIKVHFIIYWKGSVGSRVYVPFRGCELEVRHFKPMFDLGQVSKTTRFLF